MTFKSPKDEIMREIGALLSSSGWQRIYVTVSNDTFYTGFVEFGTSRMAPRAMVRRATPAIEKWMSAELKKLDFPPTMDELMALMDNLKEVAQTEIKNRTPVKTGLLKRSWQAEGPFTE